MGQAMKCCIPGLLPHFDPISWLECAACRERVYRLIERGQKKRVDRWIQRSALPALERHIMDRELDAMLEAGEYD